MGKGGRRCAVAGVAGVQEVTKGKQGLRSMSADADTEDDEVDYQPRPKLRGWSIASPEEIIAVTTRPPRIAALPPDG